MAKMGRPPKPDDERKGSRVELRLAPDEKAAFGAAAERASLSVSAWIRTRLIALARRENARKSRSKQTLREGH